MIIGGETKPFLAPPRTLPLLALLALSRAPLARERVAATLWPDVDEPKARGNVRRHLYALAKALPPALGPYVSAAGTTLTWNASPSCEVDAIRFESLVRTEQWMDAVTLYRGDLLIGFDDAWLVAERERLHARFVAAASRALEAAHAKADHRMTLALAQHVLAIDPWHEEAFRHSLIAKSKLGDHASAIAAYDAFAERLADELGVAPAPETAALAATIRRQRSLPHPTARLRPKPQPASGCRLSIGGHPQRPTTATVMH